jgi:hypothetical protein
MNIADAISQREEIQKVYIRVCRDARFKMPLGMAARMTARILELSESNVNGSLLVWIALGVDNMDRIANGTHECLDLKLYGGTKEKL